MQASCSWTCTLAAAIALSLIAHADVPPPIKSGDWPGPAEYRPNNSSIIIGWPEEPAFLCNSQQAVNPKFITEGLQWLEQTLGAQTRNNNITNGCSVVWYTEPRADILPKINTGAVLYLCGPTDVQVSGVAMASAVNVTVPNCMHQVDLVPHNVTGGASLSVNGTWTYLAGIKTIPSDKWAQEGAWR